MSCLDSLAYAYGKPGLYAVLKKTAQDFVVDEFFSFEASGEGEHTLLQIQKTNTNTEWLARQIARLAGVKSRDVSYAGLKDRNAVTTQWFSIWLPGKAEPDWSRLNSDDIQVLKVTRHSRKLRRGSLQGNRFSIRLHEVEGDDSQLATRMQSIAMDGVPNYFGEQRFGHDGQNLEMAEKLFAGQKISNRVKRSLYISAARSQIFNHLLSQRVADQSWCEATVGDVMLLNNSHSYFLLDDCTDEIKNRMKLHDIHPSGALWGQGELLTKGNVKIIEQSIANQFKTYTNGLCKVGLKQERRALRLSVSQLEWQFDESNALLTLSFSLPPGGYATSVIREIVFTK